MVRPERGIRGSFSSAVISTSFANLATPLSAILTAPLLAQALDVDGRGAVAAATSPMLLATTAGLLGLPEAATFAVARYRQNSLSILWRTSALLCTAGFCAMIVVSVVAPAIAKQEHELEVLITAASVVIVPALLIGGLRGHAAGLQAWSLINLERYSASLFRLGAICGLYWLNSLTVAYAVGVVALAPIVGGLAYLRLLSAKFSPRGATKVAVEARVPALASYGGRVWIGTLAGILLSRLDQVLMNPLASVTALGIYVVAVNIADVPTVVHNGIRDVIFAAEAKNRQSETSLIAARISFIAALAISVTIGASLPFWISVVFGDEFRASILPTLILLAAGTLGVPGSIAGAMLSAAGKPELRSISMAVAAAVNVGILIYAAPKYGANGAAIATLVGAILAANLNILLANRKLGIPVSQYYSFKVSDINAALRAIWPTARERSNEI